MVESLGGCCRCSTIGLPPPGQTLFEWDHGWQIEKLVRPHPLVTLTMTSFFVEGVSMASTRQEERELELTAALHLGFRNMTVPVRKTGVVV